MGNRRFAQVSTSDEEDEVPATKQQFSNSDDNLPIRRKRKKMKFIEEEEEELEEEREERNRRSRRSRNKGEKEVEAYKQQADDENEDDQSQEDAKPVGDAVRVSGKGRGRKSHYNAFEYDGNRYDLEDPVLLVPEDKDQKPYVAIIKDITQNKDGMMVTGQWFYRPEEAERKGGGSWQSHDTRELFYSFHRDQVPAESVMHKCVVHFVPLHKQLPVRKQHPGFIVRKVYDTVEKKLWKLTDKDYEDSKQAEIDELVKKTMSRLGDLPDIEPEDAPADQEDQLKTKRSFKRKNISPLDITRDESEATRYDHSLKAETPGSCTTNRSEYYSILEIFDVLIGETHRDKWLEKLLEGVQYICYTPEKTREDDMGQTAANGVSHENKNSEPSIVAQNSAKSGKSFLWPDAAVPAITALEKVSSDALSADFQKYNQKMRQLVFNLKNNRLLAQRLLNGELEPSKILNMSPNELKDGLTAEEMAATKEPDESERMQMTEARCSRCTECKVGVREIIQTGHGERYKLECIACGHSWYASRDELSMLTIDAATNSTNSVGTAPWATAKFEDVEKSLLSPREPEKATEDLFKKTSEAYMPVLDSPKSNKSRKEDNTEPAKNAQ
ncbi:Chromatin remodeling protein EBS, partial [Cucurbita argyrosperma subsp. sororia]